MIKIHPKDLINKMPVLFICFIILSLLACAAHHKPVQGPMDIEAESLMEKINKVGHSPDRMQAMADVEISAVGRRYTMRLALVLKKPQSLRAESLPIIGTPDFFLTINGEKMKAFLPHDGVFYIGKPTAKNFETFFPLKLPVEGLTALLMGAMPAMEKGAQFRMGSKEGDFFRVDVAAGAVKMRSLWIDSVHNRIVKTLLFDAYENPLYTFYYQDFSPAEPGIPQKIHIVLEQNNSNITIHYADIQYSIDETDTVFDLEIPPGVGPAYLD